MKTSLALLALLGSLATAQTSVMNIPALPPGKTAPASASTPTTSSPTSSPVTPAPTAPALVVAPSPSAPTVTTLPTGSVALNVSASLVGPDSVKAGQANTWDFMVKNTAKTPLHLEHGACDVRYEVLNAAGQVIRPDPKNTICTMQIVVTDVQSGEEATMQKIRWEGKDGGGNLVPAGKYTIRARFVGGGNYTPAATKEVTVQ